MGGERLFSCVTAEKALYNCITVCEAYNGRFSVTPRVNIFFFFMMRVIILIEVFAKNLYVGSDWTVFHIRIEALKLRHYSSLSVEMKRWIRKKQNLKSLALGIERKRMFKSEQRQRKSFLCCFFFYFQFISINNG